VSKLKSVLSVYKYHSHLKASYLPTGVMNKQKFPYLLIPWNRVLEKLTGLQIVKKFLAFYGTRKFIAAFTSARQLSLSHPDQPSPYPQILFPEDPS
jgi:hypothetical protein